MRTKVILVGPGGSGKDFLAAHLQRHHGLARNVAYTTRPRREGEVDGADYHFVTLPDFKAKIDAGFWHEYNCFVPELGWYYGSSKADFRDKQLFIKEPHGVGQLSAAERAQCVVVYLNVPAPVRAERMLARKGNADSVQRRLEADAQDFAGYTNYDLVVTDPNFSAVTVGHFICSLLSTSQ